MKKAQSRSATAETKQLAYDLNEESEKISEHEALTLFLKRLTSDEKYELDDVRKVSKLIFEECNENYDQFVLVSNHSTLCEAKKKLIKEDKPVFFMCNEGLKHWFCFTIVKVGNEIYLLSKSSLGIDFPSGFVNFIENNFNNEKIVKIHHSGRELKHEQNNSEANMALRNLEIMVKGLRSNKKKFIENFESCQFCTEMEVPEIKENFRERFTKQMFATLVEENDDNEFSRELTKLIDQILAYKNASRLCSDYHQLLLNETSKFVEDPDAEINIEKINEAREKIMKNQNIQTLINTKSQPQASEAPKDLKLDIEKKFPKKMWIIKKLMTIENSTLLEIVLKQISTRWKIDYGKLKQFVQIEEEEMKEKLPDFTEDAESFDDFANTERKPTTETTSQDNKSLDQIISQLRLGEEELEPAMKEKLQQDYEETMNFYREWEAKDSQAVRSWCVKKRGRLLERDFLEAIAVMNRANDLVTGGHRLRIPQLISLLMFMQFKDNQGKLCQIETGEGKTVIVSVLASLKVMQGNQVDVITSNQVLADEGVKSRKKFYGLLGLKVSCNNADENYKFGPRSCYAADVVYGSIGNFQFDYLRDTFEKLETRGIRRLNTVIVDEVDSMLIDNGGHIAKLASPFPGIECLEYVYVKIWQELMKLDKEMVNTIEEKLKQKAIDLKNDTKLSDNERQQSYDLHRTHLIRNQVDTMNESIKATHPLDLDLIPKHLKSFAEESLDAWIDNAIYAKYSCHENEKYVLKKSSKGVQVVPVDYQCTGVTLTNTVWSNGLHQFVQLKHNLSLTPETLTSSYISNVGYIGLYGSDVYGLTGTLGSSNEQKLLSKAYNVECAIIPTYKQKKFKEIDGLLAKDEDWLNTVAINAFLLSKKKRSVLIICETIRDLKEIEKNINALKKLEAFTALKVKTYIDEENSQLLQDEVGIQEIIIATNIAGRGSDFKTTDELEDFGGLHVSVSFLSINKRVQDQAFGRTARQGKSGTAQLIIKKSNLADIGLEFHPQTSSFESIKQQRDMKEKLRLDNIESTELLEIRFKDQIFELFSSLYTNFKDENGEFLANDLKEFWAFWLCKKKFSGPEVASKKIQEEFEVFKKEADPIVRGQISHNPFYLIIKAERALVADQLSKAKECLDLALEMCENNPQITATVQLKLFDVAIETGHQLMERFKKALKKMVFINLGENSKNEKYKEESLTALIKAEDAMAKEVNYLKDKVLENKEFHGILISNDGNELVKHFTSKYYSLLTFHSHIQSLKEQIKACGTDKGLALGSRIPNYLRDLKPKTENEKQLKESVKEETLQELSAVGMNTIYALREVHDVSREVIHSAQGQIGAGFALFASGVAFPPSLPFVGPLAGTLISEGICDVVIELISKGNVAFNAAAYIKGKAISYGISLVTMGVSALLSSTKILSYVSKLCKRISSFLKSCTYFKTVCEKAASYIDKLVKYLENLKRIADLEKVSRLAKKSFALQEVASLSLKFVVIPTVRGVVMSVVMEKVVTKALERSFENFRPDVRRNVEKIILEKLDRKNFVLVESEKVAKVTSEILIGTYGEIAAGVLKEIALGVLRHSNSWTAKITSIALDTAITANGIINYTDEFCKKFNDNILSLRSEGAILRSEEVINNCLNGIIDQVADKVFGEILHLAGKYASTFVVNPLMNKVFDAILGGAKPEQPAGTSNETFDEIADAYETLGLEPGATPEQIKAAYRKLISKNHPDSQEGRKDSQANEKSCKINAAYQMLNKNASNLSSQTSPDKNKSGDKSKIYALSGQVSDDFVQVSANDDKTSKAAGVPTSHDKSSHTPTSTKTGGNTPVVPKASSNPASSFASEKEVPSEPKKSLISASSKGTETIDDFFKGIKIQHDPFGIQSWLDFARSAIHVYNNLETIFAQASEYLTKPAENIRNNLPSQATRMANRGDVVVLARDLQQHILINIRNEDGTTVTREFGRNYINTDRPTITINYRGPNLQNFGHFEIDNENLRVVTTGPFDCFFDALSAGLNSNGIEMSASELRNLADRRSIPIYMQLAESTDLLNHPSVRDIELQLQSSLLIGGAQRPRRNTPNNNSPQQRTREDRNDVRTDEEFEFDRRFNVLVYLVNIQQNQALPDNYTIDANGTTLLNILQDPQTFNVLLVDYFIGQDIANRDTGHAARGWPAGRNIRFGNLVVNDFYTQATQRQIFEAAFPDSDYITDEIFLQRGHLAARADFILREDQMRTYFFGNVAAMWNTINCGNWKRVEDHVRRLAAATTRGVRVRAGTFGVMTLEGREVFLDPREQRIPVPRFMYRLVTGQGLENEVYVTFNNPYVPIHEIREEVYEIFGDVTEVSNFPNDPQEGTEFVPKGFTFRLSADDFMAGLDRFYG